MSRSLKKGPFVEASILMKLEQIKERKDRKVTTKSRSSTVIPVMIGWNFLVYNGRTYISVLITDQIVGHKLGEFAFTRLYRGHGKTEKKRKRLICVYGTKGTSCGIASRDYLLF